MKKRKMNKNQFLFKFFKKTILAKKVIVYLYLYF